MVGVGRGLLVGKTLLWVIAAASAARADVYLRRDASGVLHFTNVPAEPGYRVIFKAPPPPPSRSSRNTPRLVSFSPSRSRFDDLISEMADRYGVEEQLVRAVIKAESNFEPWAVSRKGAVGLMQLMPETAARHHVRNIYDPRQNVEGGVKHLRSLLNRYRGNVVKALVAYNAGEGVVDESGGIPRIRETREYVQRVLDWRRRYLFSRR